VAEHLLQGLPVQMFLGHDRALALALDHYFPAHSRPLFHVRVHASFLMGVPVLVRLVLHTGFHPAFTHHHYAIVADLEDNLLIEVTCEYCNPTSPGTDTSRSLINGIVVVENEPLSIKIRHYTHQARSGNGLGVNNPGAGSHAIHTIVKIEKLR
jgi:hypothetical protein